MARVSTAVERNENRLEEQDRREAIALEWKQLALVCDRFLYIFCNFHPYECFQLNLRHICYCLHGLGSSCSRSLSSQLSPRVSCSLLPLTARNDSRNTIELFLFLKCYCCCYCWYLISFSGKQRWNFFFFQCKCYRIRDYKDMSVCQRQLFCEGISFTLAPICWNPNFENGNIPIIQQTFPVTCRDLLGKCMAVCRAFALILE